MSIDDVTTQLRSQLQEVFGVEGASYLMDRPPGGWGDLVTNDSLDRRLATLEGHLDNLEVRLTAESAMVRSEISSMGHTLRTEMYQEFPKQTWRLTTAAFSMMTVLVAVMVAAVKL